MMYELTSLRDHEEGGSAASQLEMRSVQAACQAFGNGLVSLITVKSSATRGGEALFVLDEVLNTCKLMKRKIADPLVLPSSPSHYIGTTE